MTAQPFTRNVVIFLDGTGQAGGFRFEIVSSRSGTLWS
jgi:hypothetical protein